jgi:hypothetical protein
VVEDELVHGAAVDLGGRGGEGEAGQVVHARQRQVEQQRVGDLRDAVRRRWADRHQHADLARRRPVGFEIAEHGHRRPLCRSRLISTLLPLAALTLLSAIGPGCLYACCALLLTGLALTIRLLGPHSNNRRLDAI